MARPGSSHCSHRLRRLPGAGGSGYWDGLWGFRVFWFRVWGLGFRVWGLGLRVWGLGFGVKGLGVGFRLQGLESTVEGCGLPGLF